MTASEAATADADMDWRGDAAKWKMVVKQKFEWTVFVHDAHELAAGRCDYPLEYQRACGSESKGRECENLQEQECISGGSLLRNVVCRMFHKLVTERVT